MFASAGAKHEHKSETKLDTTVHNQHEEKINQLWWEIPEEEGGGNPLGRKGQSLEGRESSYCSKNSLGA